MRTTKLCFFALATLLVASSSYADDGLSPLSDDDLGGFSAQGATPVDLKAFVPNPLGFDMEVSIDGVSSSGLGAAFASEVDDAGNVTLTFLKNVSSLQIRHLRVGADGYSLGDVTMSGISADIKATFLKNK